MSNDVAPKTTYAVVIATNLYAGNFERELTAYCTGRIGECEVGDKHAELYLKDLNLEHLDGEDDPLWDCVDWVADEHGCHRPCTIYKGEKDTHYNSVLIHFLEKPTKAQFVLLQERAITFASDPRAQQAMRHPPSFPKDLQILGIYALEIRTTVKAILPEGV